MKDEPALPVSRARDYDAPSAFTPESLIREARRQKALPDEPVPEVCLLDPDGDIVRHLAREGRSRPHDGWACYHTTLHIHETAAGPVGIVGCAVGAPFAVLVAEQLFVSGCRLLISITSAGQLADLREPPYFILIDHALRDEGTSGHYLPPAPFSRAPQSLLDALDSAFDDSPVPVLRGGTWTTDAPFRETRAAIDAARAAGLLAVEMEAAALYAFAAARGRPVVCFAHVTNRMGRSEGEFEKGEANGAHDALTIAARTAEAAVRSEIV